MGKRLNVATIVGLMLVVGCSVVVGTSVPPDEQPTLWIADGGYGVSESPGGPILDVEVHATTWDASGDIPRVYWVQSGSLMVGLFGDEHLQRYDVTDRSARVGNLKWRACRHVPGARPPF